MKHGAVQEKAYPEAKPHLRMTLDVRAKALTYLEAEDGGLGGEPGVYL